MKRLLSVFACLCMLVVTVPLLSSCAKEPYDSYRNGEIRVAAMNGPTMMGLGQLHNIVSSDPNHKYKITNAGTTDVVTAGLANGTIDAAAVPANTAAILFNNGSVGVQVAAINTLNVLYLLQRDGAVEITGLSDLAGKTVHLPGQGTTPDVSFRYLLSKANVANVNINFHPDGTSIVAGLQQGQIDYAVLASPAATNSIMNGSSKEVLSLTDEWKRYNPASDVITGVLVVRTAFLKKNRTTFDEFMVKYSQSVDFMTASENLNAAAQFVVNMGIVPNINVAKNALPKSGISFITGNGMKAMLTEFYAVLHAQNAQSIGGKMPAGSFYFN